MNYHVYIIYRYFAKKNLFTNINHVHKDVKDKRSTSFVKK